MPSSSARQRIIRSILADGEIRSQNDIVDLLAEKGFTVTQATVSRDLASIGARKDELAELIARGELESAVALYRGPLLPTSDVPAVKELREHLTESLRLAVLGANDPELVFALAERMGDDLELWEAAAGLKADDPRRAVAVASVERTRRRWADET